ncbi:MAG: DUF1972 domain-containing protein [Cytophagales bacterium]
MEQKKKVAIIGTVGLPAQYGGFETLASHLVTNLSNEYDFTVYCSSKKYPKEKRLKEFNGAKLKYIPLDANGVQSVLYDSWSILNALFSNDVLIVLGVAGAWLFPILRLFTRKKIVVSIDGIEWKREKWGNMAKLYLWWAEKIAVKYSHIDISDNESIQDYTAIRYKSLSRIIEYGADHVLFVTPTDDDFKKYPFLHSQYSIKVCRIEPENNVHVVLEAFSRMNNRKLVFIGNWDKSEYGQELKSRYSVYENIIILDPIYDQRELDLLRGNASLYVHGHSAGGTNPSLVEAMYLGLPVLAYGVSYNRTTTESKAKYFRTADEIVNFVSEMDNYVLQNLAYYMKEIAKRRYTWGNICRKYNLLVHEVLGIRQKTNVNNQVAALDIETLQANEIAHLQYSNLFFEKRNTKKN